MWNFLLTIYLWLQSDYLENVEFNTWSMPPEFAAAGMNNDACEINYFASLHKASAQTWLQSMQPISLYPKHSLQLIIINTGLSY